MRQNLQGLGLLLLLGSACALYFEEGFDHHYTYSSESDILGLHNITTIVKVSGFVLYIYCKTSKIRFRFFGIEAYSKEIWDVLDIENMTYSCSI